MSLLTWVATVATVVAYNAIPCSLPEEQENSACSQPPNYAQANEGEPSTPRGKNFHLWVGKTRDPINVPDIMEHPPTVPLLGLAHWRFTNCGMARQGRSNVKRAPFCVRWTLIRLNHI